MFTTEELLKVSFLSKEVKKLVIENIDKIAGVYPNYWLKIVLLNKNKLIITVNEDGVYYFSHLYLTQNESDNTMRCVTEDELLIILEQFLKNDN